MDIRIQNTNLALTAGFPSQFPRERKPQIALSGRSNVGKSSLINTLLERKALARVSSTPGKTVTINFFDVDAKFYLVDLPGYGYAKRSGEKKQAFSSLTEDYFLKNPSSDALSLVIQLIDARIGATDDDKMMLRFLRDYGIPFAVVMTKADKLSKTQKEQAKENFKKDFPDIEEPILFSSETKEGKDILWKTVLKAI